MTDPPRREPGLGTHKINVPRSRAKEVRRQARLFLAVDAALVLVAGLLTATRPVSWWWMPALACLLSALACAGRWSWCRGWIARDERRWSA